MFIDNINHQDIKPIRLFETNVNTKKKENNIFKNYINTALGEISHIQNHAKIDAEKFILNPSETSLNDVMINLEKSSIFMQMTIQIRNKVVSAYQEIMNQQV